MLAGLAPASSRNWARLRNIEAACSSGSAGIWPLAASRPPKADEKIMLPMRAPFGMGAPCSWPFIKIACRFSAIRLAPLGDSDCWSNCCGRLAADVGHDAANRARLADIRDVGADAVEDDA